jgi:hypothetical protein
MPYAFSKFTIRRRWVTLLLVLSVAGITLVPSVAAQGEEVSHLSVVTQALNVRSGPGISYPVVGLLTRGEEVPVIGRHSPSGWWQVQWADGQSGWVSGRPAYVEVSGDTSALPEGGALPESPGPSAAGANARGTIVVQTASGGPIYTVNADGSNLRYLTTGIDPALSPDGRWVAFTRWEGPQHGAPGSLWVINVDGTGERVILDNVHQPKAPVWSPDGTQIAVSVQQGGRLHPEQKCSQGLPSEPLAADEDGDYLRVVVEADDGDVEVRYCYTLLPHPYWGLGLVDVASGAFQDLAGDLFSYAPAWDPSNDWHLVYGGEMGLVNLDLNQGTTWSLTDDVNDHTPVFSPDGSKIAVSYWQHDHWEIHVVNADGGGRVRLTQTPLRVIVEQRIRGEEGRAWNNTAPAWSPDGSQIAFLTDRAGRWEVWVMPAPGAHRPGTGQAQVNADGGDQRPLFGEDVQAQLRLEYHSVDERMISWGK